MNEDIQCTLFQYVVLYYGLKYDSDCMFDIDKNFSPSFSSNYIHI